MSISKYVLSKSFKRLFYFGLVMFFLDGILTYTGYRLFAPNFLEFNPIAILMASSIGWFHTAITVKLLTSLLVLGCWQNLINLYRYDTDKSRILTMTMYFLVVIVLFMVVLFSAINIVSLSIIIPEVYANVF